MRAYGETSRQLRRTYLPSDKIKRKMNDFYDLSAKQGTDKVMHHGYHFFYPTYLEKLRDQEFKMLEIGHLEGQSARMWTEYFPKAEVFVMDIKESNPTGSYEIIVGDQGNQNDLINMIGRIGSTRFIIDDGSHHPIHQYETFNFLFRNLLEPGGIYIIEDIECNYWNYQQAPYGYRLGFFNAIDQTKKLIDLINAEFSGKKNDIGISSMTYGQNCIIITKQTEEEQKYFDRQYRFIESTY
jgi:hypothetical protein